MIFQTFMESFGCIKKLHLTQQTFNIWPAGFNVDKSYSVILRNKLSNQEDRKVQNSIYLETQSKLQRRVIVNLGLEDSKWISGAR